MNDNKTALVIICDDKYLSNNYGFTCLKSFLYNNKWFNGDIIFFDDGEFFTISNDNKTKLKSLYNKIIFKKINFNTYKWLIDLFSFNNIDFYQNYEFIHCIKRNLKLLKAYPKFEIFNLKEYDKILCIDADILFVDNVKELFNKDISFGVTSSLYYNSQNIKLQDIKDINSFRKNNDLIEFDSGGFNSGVIYIGNKNLLNGNITNEILEFCKEKQLNINNKKYPVYFFDQCIFNYFFTEKYNDFVTFISPIYNMCIAKFTIFNSVDEECLSDFYKELKEHSKIWHFLYKPLQLNKNHYYKKVWNNYKDMTL